MNVKMLERTFQPNNGDWVRIAAAFNNWGTPQDTLAREPSPSDSIYRITRNFSVGDTLSYKYVKTLRGGAGAENSTRGYRVPAGGGTIPLVWFDDDVVADTLVSGNVTFRLDMRALTGIGWFLPAVDSLQVRGEFNSWIGEPMTLSPITGTWNATVPFLGTPLREYKFKYYMKLDLASAGSRFPGFFLYLDNIQYEQLYTLGGGGVRVYTLPFISENISVGPYNFSDIHRFNTLLNTTDTSRVTVSVNMGPATRYVDPFVPSADTLFLVWKDFAWALNQSANQGNFPLRLRMTRSGATDSVWSVSFRVRGKTHSGMMYVYEYKHAGGGGVVEGGGGGVLNPYRVRYIPRTAPNTFPLTYTAPLDEWQKQPPMPVEPAIVDDVKEDNSRGAPTGFSLSQNYPNPFNPATQIRYSLSEKSYVLLNVYNILGQQVVELVNQEQGRGNYIALFEGNNLASGVYFYRLSAWSLSGRAGIRQTKKMLLTR
jgi:hypothetical protein